MSLFGPSAAEWAAMADALGLAPYKPTAAYQFGASFRQVKRALGVRAPWPNLDNYLYGTRNGAELVVHRFEEGAGDQATTFTGALARIDPPLFLGLTLRRKGFFEGFGTQPVLTGDPGADARLHLEAHEVRRAASLLARGLPDGDALRARVLALLEHHLEVSDSTVRVAMPGVFVDARVAWMADQATTLAGAFAARRAAMPPTAGELAIHAEWQRFAEANRVTFDAPRMKIDGEIDGARVEVAVETVGASAFTAVTALFPQTLDVAFSALQTSIPSFLQGLFGQDIRVGHPAFDDRYQVSGHPPEAVREILGRPGVADHLAWIATYSGDAMMNQHGLYFRVRQALRSADELTAFTRAVRAVSAALFGAARSIGPYR